MTMRSQRRLISALVGLLFVLMVGYLERDGWISLRTDRPTRRELPASDPREGVCVRVIDGDTVELEGGERVRLIGVDTPETVDPRRPVERYGKEAASFTRDSVEGKSVRLEFGPESTDRYGRTLAYVYLADGTLLNAEIIRQGYGFAYTRFPHPRLEAFVGLEREAREAGRGLWAK